MQTHISRAARASAGLAIAALVVCGAIGSAATPANYKLANAFTLGGDGGWDYISYDPGTKHVFISRATRVMVVDPSNGSVVGEVPDTSGVHGIAAADDLGKAFTSNGRDSSVTVFDLHTLKTIVKIPIQGKNPDAIAYDPNSKHVFTMNGGSSDATVIDAATTSVVAEIPLPGRPEFVVSGHDGMVYANIEDKSEIVQIDTAKNTVTNTWSLTPCEGPSGLAADAAHHRLFSVCGNRMMAISDTQAGKVVTTVPIGPGPDAAGFDPATQLAFSSNGGDGTVTVVHEDSPSAFSVVQNATAQRYARTMTVDTDTHNVYLVTADIQLGTPAPGQTRPSRTMVPGSFRLLVLNNP